MRFLDIYLIIFIFIYKTFETILRSLYDLLGPNIYIHQPVTDETVEQHSAVFI